MAAIVLDEDVYRFALSAEQSQATSDEQAAAFVQCLQSRHQWIVTLDLVRAYRRHFSSGRFGKGGRTSLLMKSFDQVLFDSSRLVWVPHPSSVAGSYHDDDRHVVAAAAAVRGCYLVTSDQPLLEALARDGLPERCGFNLLDYPAALELLCT